MYRDSLSTSASSSVAVKTFPSRQTDRHGPVDIENQRADSLLVYWEGFALFFEPLDGALMKTSTDCNVVCTLTQIGVQPLNFSPTLVY
jgi:hypothetical protein